MVSLNRFQKPGTRLRSFRNLLVSTAGLLWCFYVLHLYLPALNRAALHELRQAMYAAALRFGLLDLALVSWVAVTAYLVGNRGLDLIKLSREAGSENLLLSTGKEKVLYSLRIFSTTAEAGDCELRFPKSS